MYWKLQAKLLTPITQARKTPEESVFGGTPPFILSSVSERPRRRGTQEREAVIALVPNLDPRWREM